MDDLDKEVLAWLEKHDALVRAPIVRHLAEERRLRLILPLTFQLFSML